MRDDTQMPLKPAYYNTAAKWKSHVPVLLVTASGTSVVQFSNLKKHRIAGQMQETYAEHGDSKFQNETEIQNDPSRLKQMHRLSSSE